MNLTEVSRIFGIAQTDNREELLDFMKTASRVSGPPLPAAYDETGYETSVLRSLVVTTQA